MRGGRGHTQNRSRERHRTGTGTGGRNANGTRGAVRARPLPAALQSAHTSARCAFRDILSGEAGPGLCASAVRGGAGPGKGGVGVGEGRGGGAAGPGAASPSLPPALPAARSPGGSAGSGSGPAPAEEGPRRPRPASAERRRPAPHPPPRTAPRSAAQRTARPERRTGCGRGSCGWAALQGQLPVLVPVLILVPAPVVLWFWSRFSS